MPSECAKRCEKCNDHVNCGPTCNISHVDSSAVQHQLFHAAQVVVSCGIVHRGAAWGGGGEGTCAVDFECTVWWLGQAVLCAVMLGERPDQECWVVSMACCGDGRGWLGALRDVAVAGCVSAEGAQANQPTDQPTHPPPRMALLI